MRAMRRDIDAGEDSATLPVRELLRRETAAAHRAVELLPRMRRLLQPDGEDRWQGKALLDALKKLRPGKVKASRRGSQLPPLYGSGA